VRLTKKKRCGHGYKKGMQNKLLLGTNTARNNLTLYLTTTGALFHLTDINLVRWSGSLLGWKLTVTEGGSV